MKLFIILSLIFIGFSNPANSQTTSITEGDLLEIGSPSNYEYSFINFPKANFIIKKGGIADYSKLAGTSVKVTNIEVVDNKTIITFKRNDGEKFFGNFSEISANYAKAIASRELLN